MVGRESNPDITLDKLILVTPLMQISAYTMHKNVPANHGAIYTVQRMQKKRHLASKRLKLHMKPTTKALEYSEKKSGHHSRITYYEFGSLTI